MSSSSIRLSLTTLTVASFSVDNRRERPLAILPRPRPGAPCSSTSDSHLCAVLAWCGHTPGRRDAPSSAKRPSRRADRASEWPSRLPIGGITPSCEPSSREILVGRSLSANARRPGNQHRNGQGRLQVQGRRDRRRQREPEPFLCAASGALL